jgi:hypothetical protein
MTTKRKTGIDYRKEWDDIQQIEKSLSAHVRVRIKELCKKYPDAPITADATAKNMNKLWLSSLPTTAVIYLIEKIEKWSADQQKIEQLYIEMPDEIKKTLKKLSE